MSLSLKLQQQLETVLYGDAWYGPTVYNLIERVDFETAHERPPNNAHSIAEMLLHMIGWTQEVISRMQGNFAGTPPAGDWPDAGEPDEEKWQARINYFKLVNVELAGIIQNFPEEKWEQPINDERGGRHGGVTHEALITGIIQHHIYHAAQIAALQRVVGG